MPQTPSALPAQAGQKGLNTELRASVFDSPALGSHGGFLSGRATRLKMAAACWMSRIERTDGVAGSQVGAAGG